MTVTDDFSGGGIRFVVDGMPAVVDADAYKIELVNGSVGPHVLISAGLLPPGTTTEEFLEIVRANPDGPPEGIVETGYTFAQPGHRAQKAHDLTQPGTYGYHCSIHPPSLYPNFVGIIEVRP